MDVVAGLFLFVAFVVFPVGVGAILIITGIVNLRRARRSVTWPEVPGKIVMSRVEEKRHAEGDRIYFPKIVFEYEVHGVRYVSDAVVFAVGGWEDEETIRRWVARYHRGDRVSVYYDPNKPKVSVLEPENVVFPYARLISGVGILAVWGAIAGWELFSY